MDQYMYDHRHDYYDPPFPYHLVEEVAFIGSETMYRDLFSAFNPEEAAKLYPPIPEGSNIIPPTTPLTAEQKAWVMAELQRPGAVNIALPIAERVRDEQKALAEERKRDLALAGIMLAAQCLADAKTDNAE